MKLYDKVYVPGGEGHGVYFDVNRKSVVANRSTVSYPTESFSLKELTNVIVLTIEEAKEIWDAAQDRACALQMGEPGDTKIFEAFLQSKGINI